MAETTVKLKADVAPFKKAMTEAKTATKTLDAELKLAQAQFKATGDAEQYLDTRTKVLAQQITQQQKAADAARSALEQMRNAGVEPTSTAYQNMERAMLDAERQMVQLRQEADKAGDEVLDLSKDSDKLSQSLENIGKSSKFSAIADGFNMVSSITRTVWSNVQRIGNVISSSTDWADDLITTAKRYGLSTTELQQYQYASRFVDTEVDAILKARDKLMSKTKNEGIMFLVDGMDQYAIQLHDVKGEARDSMDIFWDFIDVLGEFKNETDRDSVAQEYFGKSFRDLITLVQTGRSGWEEYMNSASVVSEKDVQKLGEIDDKLEEIDARWQTLKNTVIADFAPGVISALEGVYNAIQSIGEIGGKAAMWVMDLLGIDYNSYGREVQTFDTSGPLPAYDPAVVWTGGNGAYGPASPEQIAAAHEAANATVEAYAAGVEANASAAYAAGAALGAAAAQGVGAGVGAIGSTTNSTTNQNFGDTYNYYNNGYTDYAEQQRRVQAGYGG